MNAPLRLSLTLLLFLFVTANVNAQRINGKMQDEDKRLSAKATFVAKHAYLGELLEALTKQSGVNLSASDEDEAAGEELIVHLSDVPIADTMNAVQSLLSYKGVTWAWERTKGEDDQWYYRLVRPRTADTLPTDMKNAVQKSFEQHASAVLQAIATPNSNTPPVDEMTRKFVAHARTRDGLELFSQLPEDTRMKILRGEQSLQVAVKSLSTRGQELASSASGASDVQEVSFSMKSMSGEVVPSFFIMFDNSGYGYLGGSPLEAVWNDRIKQEWIRSQDVSLNSREEAAIDVSKPSAGAKDGSNVAVDVSDNASLSDKLLLLAQRGSVALLCRYPTDNKATSAGNPLTGTTLGSQLTQFEEQSPHLIHKWHGNVLLMMPRNIVVTGLVRGQRVHWNAVKKLRSASTTDPDACLPLDTLLLVASELQSSAFVRTMDMEFEGSFTSPSAHTLLVLLTENPTRQNEVLSSQGTSVTPKINRVAQEAVGKRDTFTAEQLTANKVTGVRITQERQLVTRRSRGTALPSKLQAQIYLYFRMKDKEWKDILLASGRCLAVPEKPDRKEAHQ